MGEVSRVCSSFSRSQDMVPPKLAMIRNETCPICLSKIQEERAAMIGTCKHLYCITCIRKWSQLRRNCPLCNRDLNGWFFNFRASKGNFQQEEHLPPLETQKKKSVTLEEGLYGFDRNHRTRFLASQRLINESRRQCRTVNRLSRPLPWRRSFAQSRLVRQRCQDEGDHERVLQWRASIYRRHLQAVPLHFPLRTSARKRISGNNTEKEKARQRVEPWIWRELQAILGDTDPTVIVHLATSLWISYLEEEQKDPTGSSCGRQNFIQQLKPFLHDRTDMFWHELRCFAESPFTIAAYDSVVEYRRMQ